MKVRLIQLDGALPNIALMKLAHWYRAKGHEVLLTRHIERTLFEPEPDLVLASSIFDFSEERRRLCRQQWPLVTMGGTGTTSKLTVEEHIGELEYEHYDYADYPQVDYSIGFTQRGCRLSCKFCVVPQKEGKPRSVNAISGLWRGEPYPKKLLLLDNDFFGQAPEKFAMRTQEIVAGGFRVCFAQGINIRFINPAACVCLRNIEYRDTQFQCRRLYTAWDNLGDEARFFAGVDMLEHFGVPATHLMAYMLVGYDIAETWERIWYRFKRMVDRGILPYPMVYDRKRKDLLCFQRWVNTGLYRIVPWNEYQRETKTPQSVEGWMRAYAA